MASAARRSSVSSNRDTTSDAAEQPEMLPVKLPALVPSMDYEADMTELLQITGSLQDVRGQLEPIVTQYHETTERLIQARTAGYCARSNPPSIRRAYEGSGASPFPDPTATEPRAT